MRRPLCVQNNSPDVFSALELNPNYVNLLSFLLFLSLVQFTLCPGRSNTSNPPLFLGVFFFFSVRLPQQSKKYRLCLNMANERHMSLLTGLSPLETNRLKKKKRGKKKHIGPALCSTPFPHFKLSRVWWGCCAPRSTGVHQAPGVGMLSLASSNTTTLRSPTAPSLFNRAMLSFGMTTWARSLVIREISWATQTKMKVLTKMLREGFPGIRTKIPFVSAASQMWYWHMNSWGRQKIKFSTKCNVCSPRTLAVFEILPFRLVLLLLLLQSTDCCMQYVWNRGC